MTVLPVIIRELRSQARQPLTYWLRVLAAGTLLAAFVFGIAGRGFATALAAGMSRAPGGSPFGDLGALLFGRLNAAILLCNCLLAPLLTADCISREKREGTLGLLFLTNLSPRGIVTGKGFVHMARGVTLFLAMLPVIAVPILLGGVSGQDCLMALLIDTIVLVVGLAAGLLASAYARDWVRALVLAEVLSVSLVTLFMYTHVSVLDTLHIAPNSLSSESLIRQWTRLFYFHTNIADVSQMWVGAFATPAIVVTPSWADLWTSSPHVQSKWFMVVAICLAGSLLFFAWVIVLAARKVRMSWQEEPAPRKITELQRSLTRPRFGVPVLRRLLSRSLDRNPIGWLHQYSWNARSTKWGWCFFVVIVECLLATDFFSLGHGQAWLVLLVSAGLAFSAAGSFRKERETGALELLLVCPLRVNQIINGRLLGIWMQFLPAAVIIAFCIRLVWRFEFVDWIRLAPFLMAYIAIPVIGLHFSLCRMSFLFAWGSTLLLGIVIPIAFVFRRGFLWFVIRPEAEVLPLLLVQAIPAALCWYFLYTRLNTRRFAFAQASV